MKTKALVLSGGAVKGSFQAGAIKAVIEHGFIPDIIYGISVGSLNGAFLAMKAAEIKRKTGADPTPDDWKGFAQSLVNFWTENIKEPNDVAIQRNILVDAWDILMEKFDGLSDTTPIGDDVDKLFSGNAFENSPVKLIVGTVD